MSDAVLRCVNVTRTYQDSGSTVKVLQGVDFELQRGERVAIMGESGSGKTTLLQILGGLDKPTSGEIIIRGQNIAVVDDQTLTKIRNEALGFVYQFHHLLDEFSAMDNVAMPLFIRGENIAKARAKASEMLDRVGLAHRFNHKPGQLSGGERQRAAVARALVGEPDCVLADEPTGNLDSENAAQVTALMAELNNDLGISFIVVTHSETMAEQMGRTMRMVDGSFI